MKKFANKERELLMYIEGKDVYGKEFWVQDGSFACFSACRIYHNEDKKGEHECLSLKINEAKKLIKGLQKFIKENS